MSSHPTFKRSLALFAGALLMSSIAIGAAIGPAATASPRPLIAVTYA